MPPDKDYGLALVEARRRLDGQLSLVEASRDRASNLLGLGGLIGTFVGGLGAIRQDNTMTCALWLASGAFGVAVVAALMTLTPRTFHTDMQAATLVEWVDDGHDRADQERTLALRVEKQYTDNQPTAELIQWALLVVVLSIAVEFAALAYQLIRST